MMRPFSEHSYFSTNQASLYSVFSRRDFLRFCLFGFLGSFALDSHVSFNRTFASTPRQNTENKKNDAKLGNAFIVPINQQVLPKESQLISGLPGSVMKLMATIILLENYHWNVDTKYDCLGYIEPKITNGKLFYCSHAHGSVDLNQALAFSCNAYFAKAIQVMSVESFESMWQAFFPQKKFAYRPQQDQLFMYLLGYLPEVELMAFDLLSWMRLIASNGKTRFPGQTISPKIKNIHPYTWNVLHQGMRSAARWGTGKLADPEDRYHLALKTGTTKQGERFQSWVAGFFPFENPTHIFCCRGINGTSEASAVPLLKKALSVYGPFA